MILLLPLTFFTVYRFYPKLGSDDQVFTPKNLMLFIWLNKMVLIPLELLIVGNKVDFFKPSSDVLDTEIYILIVAFLGFVIGWNLKVSELEEAPVLSHKAFKALLFSYLIVGILSIVIFYGSLNSYFAESWLTPATHKNLERLAGTAIGYLSNVGQRFLPFGIILAWIYWRKYFKTNIIINFLWLVLCFFSTLSSNRSNTLFPLLAFLSIMYSFWKPRSKLLVLLYLFCLMLFFFFYGFVRGYSEVDTQQVQHLFENYINEIDHFWFYHQIYFGTPYQISPLLEPHSIQYSTLLPSILDPIPILGKSFREHSGPYIYNSLIQTFSEVQDKVIPVAGELHYNGGILLVSGGHFVIGWAYSRLDFLFKQNVVNNSLFSLCIFYTALLFSALLSLSISVFVQFMIFNAAPVLIILLVLKLKE